MVAVPTTCKVEEGWVVPIPMVPEAVLAKMLEVPFNPPPAVTQYGKNPAVMGEEVDTEPVPPLVDVTYLFPVASRRLPSTARYPETPRLVVDADCKLDCPETVSVVETVVVASCETPVMARLVPVALVKVTPPRLERPDILRDAPVRYPDAVRFVPDALVKKRFGKRP